MANPRTLKRHMALTTICLALNISPLSAEMPPTPQQAVPAEAQPAAGFKVERISPGVFRIGSILMKKADRSVTFPATVNMNKGLLEYLLVRSSGKTHESLLRTSVEPSDLQLALLLLGLEGTSRPVSAQGAPEVPTGEPVLISISVTQPDGRIFDFSPQAWIAKKAGESLQTPEQMQFVFTGSQISGGRFMSQVDGSMISIYHDPAAMIDNAAPGGESDEIWFANEAGVPPVGTPVTITITSSK